MIESVPQSEIFARNQNLINSNSKFSNRITDHNWEELKRFDTTMRETAPMLRLDSKLQMAMGYIAHGKNGYFGHTRLEHSTDVSIKAYIFAIIQGLNHEEAMIAAAGGSAHDFGHIVLSHTAESILSELKTFDSFGFKFNHDDLSIIIAHISEVKERIVAKFGSFEIFMATLISDEYTANPEVKWTRVLKLFDYLKSKGFELEKLQFNLLDKSDLEFVSRSDLRMISRIFHDDADTASYISLDFRNSPDTALNRNGIDKNQLGLLSTTDRITIKGQHYFHYSDVNELRGYWIRFSRLYTDVTLSAPLLTAKQLARPAVERYLSTLGKDFPLLEIATGKPNSQTNSYYGCLDFLKDIGLLTPDKLGERSVSDWYPNYVVVTWNQGLQQASETEMTRLSRIFNPDSNYLEFPETIASMREKFGRGREFVAEPEFFNRFKDRLELDGNYCLNKKETVQTDSFKVTALPLGPTACDGLHRYYISNRLKKRVVVAVRHDVNPLAVLDAVNNEVKFGKVKLVDSNGIVQMTQYR